MNGSKNGSQTAPFPFSAPRTSRPLHIPVTASAGRTHVASAFHRMDERSWKSDSIRPEICRCASSLPGPSAACSCFRPSRSSSPWPRPPRVPSDNVSPAVRAAMQRDLGLTSAQLSQYLKIERLAMLQEKQLAKTQGRNFAGSWIERKPNGSFQLVVATTSIRPQKGAAGVEYPQRAPQPGRARCVQGTARRRAGARRQGAQGRVRLVRRPAQQHRRGQRRQGPAAGRHRLRRRQRRRCAERALGRSRKNSRACAWT